MPWNWGQTLRQHHVGFHTWHHLVASFWHVRKMTWMLTCWNGDLAPWFCDLYLLPGTLQAITEPNGLRQIKLLKKKKKIYKKISNPTLSFGAWNTRNGSISAWVSRCWSRREWEKNDEIFLFSWRFCGYLGTSQLDSKNSKAIVNHSHVWWLLFHLMLGFM